MIKDKLSQKVNKNNYNDEELILNNIENLSEINECEYIYIDKVDINMITSTVLKNKVILTKKLDNYFMLENINNTNTQMTKLDYKQIVDLMILNKNQKQITNDIEELTDNDTIIIKNLETTYYTLKTKEKK